MATSSDIFCDICAAQDVTKLAMKWCPECEEAFCPDCIKPHSISKLLRKHAAIDIEDHKKLPEFVSSIPQSCEEHDEKYQMFCTLHDVPCCGQCIAYKHNSCQGLLPMADILENAKTSCTLHNTEDTLSLIKKNIYFILQDRKQNMKNVECQINSIKNVVKATREKLFKHLEQLEKDLLTKIEKKASEIKEQTNKVLQDLEVKYLKIQEYQDNVKAIKEYGTNMQTYFVTREFVKYTESEQMRINKLFEDETLNNCNIQFKLNENISRCLNAESFGNLLLTSTESSAKPVQIKVLAAQISKPVMRTKPIDDMKLVLMNKFRVFRGGFGMTITGCDVTPDGKLVFTDCYHNKRLVLHTVDGIYITEISICPNYAFDVSVIDNQSVIVSSADFKKMQIVNISTKHEMNAINTNNACYGISYVNGQVIYSYNTGIVSYNIKDNLSTTIRAEALGDWSYVSCFQNKIYYTNTVDSSVKCLNGNGEIIWRFTDNSLINNPLGITTDRYGNVYVASSGNSTIVVLSADGKRGRKILDTVDGINDARVICYDKWRNRLVIANYTGDVFVFDIV